MSSANALRSGGPMYRYRSAGSRSGSPCAARAWLMQLEIGPRESTRTPSRSNSTTSSRSGTRARVRGARRASANTTPGSAHSARRLIVPQSLDRRRRHLGEMHEGPLVLHGEVSALLVEELDRPELTAVEGSQQ